MKNMYTSIDLTDDEKNNIIYEDNSDNNLL